MTPFTLPKPPHETRFISLIVAIVSAIVSVFGVLYRLESSKFHGLTIFYVFCRDFEFELENDGDALTSHTIDTIGTSGNTQAPGFEFDNTSTGERDFNIDAHVFGLVFDEYEFSNEMNTVIDIYFNDNDNVYYYGTSGMFIFDSCCFLFVA